MRGISALWVVIVICLMIASGVAGMFLSQALNNQTSQIISDNTPKTPLHQTITNNFTPSGISITGKVIQFNGVSLGVENNEGKSLVLPVSPDVEIFVPNPNQTYSNIKGQNPDLTNKNVSVYLELKDNSRYEVVTITELR